MDFSSLMAMFSQNPQAAEQFGPSMNFAPSQNGPGMADYLKGTGQTLSGPAAASGNPMGALSLMSMMGKGQQQPAQLGAQSLRGMPGALPRTSIAGDSAYTQAQAVNPYATAMQPRRMHMPMGLMNFLGR